MLAKMWKKNLPSRWLLGIIILGMLPSTGFAGNILKTSGFTNCVDDGNIKIDTLDIEFDRNTKQITFNVGGSSAKEQKVTAFMSVTAYGKEVYKKDFNPCDEGTKVDQLCPVPEGAFAAKGVQDVPPEFVSQIPSIAFNVPDLEGDAKLELKPLDGGKDLACIQSQVTNGKTFEAPAVPYIAAGICGAALLVSGFAALGNVGQAGAHSPSPSFGDVFGWFQSISLNGMMSVSYPPVYQSFSRNFAFSGGLIPWDSMQKSIDNFRQKTGGNLTEDSVSYLRNATLVNGDDQSKNLTKRGIEFFFERELVSRDTAVSVNGTQAGNGTAPANGTSSDANNKVTHVVHGIQGYVEQLTIPQANTFMTVLLIFAIVIAGIAVGILLFKVILETWALFGSFPKRLTGFRKRYWGLLGRTIVNLILLLYGVWTLYCIYQFTNGDSWAAKLLAGITLGIFTAILGFFTFRIWHLAQKFKKAEGDASALFEDKETWRKYSLFYDNFKKGYWWLFIPTIVYLFARGCVIAGGNGHGLAQTGGQLIVESVFFLLILFCRPFITTSGTWINVVIHAVRVLSVVCILVFVEELGIAQSTKTVTGVILIAVQSVLTAVLGILIAVNAIIVCVRENPHRKQRKQAEKINRDLDDLTPLDARNSLLIDPVEYTDSNKNKATTNVKSYPLDSMSSRRSSSPMPAYRDQTPTPPGSRGGHRGSRDGLVGGAAAMGMRHDRSSSRDSGLRSPTPLGERQPTVPLIGRQPTVPDMNKYRGMAY